MSQGTTSTTILTNYSTPVTGCPGCAGTAGRHGCPEHGCFKTLYPAITFDPPGLTAGRCAEIAHAIPENPFGTGTGWDRDSYVKGREDAAIAICVAFGLPPLARHKGRYTPDTPNSPRSESPRSTGVLGPTDMQRKTEVE